MSSAAASVLTLEENPIARAELRVVLEEAGFSVCASAKDDADVLVLARALQPDVIVLDLDASQSGEETTRRILADRVVPIIALSDRADRRSSDAVIEASVTHLRKPYATPELVDAIRDAVHDAGETALAGRRAESLAAFTAIARTLGYPPEWAAELERRAFADGKVWRLVHGETPSPHPPR
jgi:DNA-binding response OmpR family regulator